MNSKIKKWIKCLLILIPLILILSRCGYEPYSYDEFHGAVQTQTVYPNSIVLSDKTRYPQIFNHYEEEGMALEMPRNVTFEECHLHPRDFSHELR